MKRLLSLLLVVCLVFGLAAQAIAATLTPSADKTEVQAGEQVVVTLTLDENLTNMNNLEYNLYFDDRFFENPVGQTMEGNTSLVLSNVKEDPSGNKLVSISYLDTLSEGSGNFLAGPIYQLTFVAKKTVSSAADASFRLEFGGAMDADHNEVTHAAGASITVTVKPQAVPATSVTLSAETLALTLGGEAATLTATVAPENATDSVVWSVEPEGIVNVDNGTVTAVAAGTATITATAGSVYATCAVTVGAAQAECDHAETEKETSYTAGETAGTHVKTVTCKACGQPVGDPVTETCVGTEADPHKCACGAACNQLPVLKEGVEPTKTVVIQTGHSYQLHDVTNGNIFMDPDGDELTYASYFFRKSTDGHTWGDWETFRKLEHGGINDSVVNGAEGTYYYEFRAYDGIGYSEQTWTLVLDTRNEVPANVKFYLGQDQNYKNNGNVMPTLELYKTAGIDGNLFDYVGWFIKNGETVYVYDPHDYAITDGTTDYVTVDGQQYELFGYEKVSFTNSAFDDADTTATASNTVVDGYNMFYVTVSTGRYSTRAYGTDANGNEVYLGGQSMELPMEVDIYGNGGNDLYLRVVSVYTSSKKTDDTYFTADDYYAEMIMPITGSMIHAGDPYVSGNYTYFPFMSWAAGNGSLYNAYVYPKNTDNYIFNRVGNQTTTAGTSVVNKSIALSAAVLLKAIVPVDGDFGLYFQFNNFNTEEVEPVGEPVINGDGTKTISYRTTKNSGSYTWRLVDTTGAHVTSSGWIKVTADAEKVFNFSQFTDKKSHDFSNLGTQVATRDEADIQVFLSHSGFKSTTEKTRIRAYRMWQIIDSDTANIMVDADFNVQVLQGNESDISLVSGGNAVNNWIDVTPTTTDIVAVNYDALDVYTTSDNYGSHGGFFPATNPERTNVFVITNENAGTAAAYIPFNGSKDTDRGAKWDYNYDTWFYLNSDTDPKMDFAVTGGSDLQVSYAAVITDASLNSTLSGWTALTAENGTYYVDLLPFRTAGTKGGTVIIKMTDSTGTSYELVRVAEMQIDITNASNPGESIMPGDDVTVTFDGMYRSVNKISGIFNPVTYRLRYYAGEKMFESGIAQYKQMDTTTLTLTIPENITFPDGETKTEYRFTDGHIDGGMYSASYPFDAMYYITDAGVGTNFSAVNTAFVLSHFADIPIEVAEKVYYNVKLNVTDGTNALTGYTLTLTDQEGNPVTAQEDGSFRLGFGTYRYSVVKSGYVAKSGSFTLSSATKDQLVEGIFAVSVVLTQAAANAWDGATVTEPGKDGSDVYQIGTGAELAWFAQSVNGGSTKLKGVLTADIDLAGYEWPTIGTNSKKFAGSFDGQNHTIKNLAISYAGTGTASPYKGLFGYVNGTSSARAVIQNLSVEGSIYLTSTKGISNTYSAGVVGYATYADITNVHSDVDITVKRELGTWNYLAGVAGNASNSTITNCSNTGDIVGWGITGGVVGNVSASTVTGCLNSGNITAQGSYAAGVAAYLQNATCSVTNCYNTGVIIGNADYTGGIVGRNVNTAGITNCYNAGTVDGNGNVCGAVIGQINKADTELDVLYYLEGTCANGIGENVSAQNAAEVSAAEMESGNFVKTMNTGVKNPAYAVGTTHPILRWENPDAEVVAPVLVSNIEMASAMRIKVNETGTLSAVITPENAENKTIVWSSSNEAVATVENGIVSAKKGGTATITAAATDGSEVTAACTVTVPVSTTGVTLNKETTSITKGGTETLVATVAPANATNQNVTWSSSNTAVATVDANGLVTAVDGGTATITVTTADGSFTDTCEVTVIVPATGVSLNKTEMTLNKGQNETLTATVAPANATNQNVTWSSSNTAVATVENGVVTAVDGGTATITATTEDGSKTATCTVTVIVPVTGVTLNKETTSITKGGTETLVATVAPANATNQNVTWSSSNTAVATVKDGVVTAVDGGTAMITVTTADGSLTDTCEVTVIVPVESVSLDQTELNLKHGDVTSDPVTLTATVLPANATNKAVAWTSSDETVAKVENGVVTPVGAGTAVITVVTVDGSKKATCEVAVVENYAVTGQVLLHDGTQPGHAVNVKIMRGATKVMETDTLNDGSYVLHGVETGTYNLIATENDGRTTTALIEVKANASVGTVKLPEANVSSELAVTKDTPEVVVGGLNELAELHGDTEAAEKKHVTVKMDVAEQDKTKASGEIKTEIDAIEKVINDTSRETVFVTINLKKQADGENTATAITDTGDVLLKIIVPFDLEGKKSVKVYRYHGSAVDELRETANADGEKIELDREKNQIMIHAKKFSTYAISASEKEDAPETYTVTILDGTGSGEYKPGDTVYIKAEVPNGYRFKEWLVAPSTVTLKSKTSAATTFTMPACDVVIRAGFEKMETSEKKDEAAKKMSFTDVKASDWFYDEVKYVYEAGIMTGLSATKFGPNQTTTRGMIVTMLYRLEGSPEVEGMSIFRDVNPNAYFADAIKWAAKNKIVEGYDGKFAPNDAITREQMATILYRYCKYKGYDVSAKGDLSVFTDAAQISDYAKDAMAWAVGIGLYNGRGDGTIVAPQDNATRAEVAAILMRFMERKK